MYHFRNKVKRRGPTKANSDCRDFAIEAQAAAHSATNDHDDDVKVRESAEESRARRVSREIAIDMTRNELR